MRNTFYCVTNFAANNMEFLELRSMAEEAYNMINGHRRLEKVNMQYGTAKLIKEAF